MIIAINRTDAIGDTLLTLPMARVIKHFYPDSKIIFIISERTKEIFTNNPDIHDVWVVDLKKNWTRQIWGLLKKMRHEAVDTYLYVGGLHWITFCAWLSNVKIRGGLISRWPSFLFLNKGQRQSRRMVVMHESEYNLNLLNDLNIQWEKVPPEIWKSGLITLVPKELESADQILLSDFGISREQNIIVVHPGMSGHTLNWASRNYGRLITRILTGQPDKFQFIISYTASDSNFLAGIRDQLSRPEFQKHIGKFHFYDGTSRGLRIYMAILKRAKIFIGPSTGPTHLAAALGTHVVALFSPIKVQSARRWGPLSFNQKQVKNIVPDVICGEVHHCAGEVCPYYECMSKIEVEDVVKEVQLVIRQLNL